MQRILTSELQGHLGERVLLAGWLHHQRRLSKLSFLVLRDRSGSGPGRHGGASRARTPRCPPARVGARGRRHGRRVGAGAGGVEIRDPEIAVLVGTGRRRRRSSCAGRELNAQLPTLLDHAAVALAPPAPAGRRSRCRGRSVAGLPGQRSTQRAASPRSTRRRSSRRRPRAAPTSSRVDYFGRPAYLAQSPQFYKQTMVGVFERVYETGPVFRAEPHDTARHLAEYVSLDAELGLHHRPPRRDGGRCATVLAGMVAGGREPEPPRLDAARARRCPSVPAEIPSIALRRRAAPDRASDRRVASRASPTCAPAHERWLGDWAQREHGSDFLFVDGYPMAKRPFYTHPDPAGPSSRTASTCSSAGSSWSPAASGCTATTDYLAALAARGQPRRRSRATSRRSGTACRRTAASPSAWSAGWPGSPAPPTSARRPCSRATAQGLRPDRHRHLERNIVVRRTDRRCRDTTRSARGRPANLPALSSPGENDRLVGERFGLETLDHKPVEEEAPVLRGSPVEAERELVQVGVQVLRGDATLMSPEHPALDE